MSRVSSWFLNSSTEDIVAFSAISFLQPHMMHKLVRVFDSLSAVVKASKFQLLQAGLTDFQAQSIMDRPTDVAKQLELMKRLGIRLIVITDKDYPACLREISDPPLWLYVQGDLAAIAKPVLTVVGSRKPTNAALSALEQILPPTVASQLTIASGLAYGVDKKAHEIALGAKTSTIAVLAGGLDRIYPASHAGLAKRIIEHGGVLISEYPPLSKSEAYRFPIRNRILAGLSPVTLIGEASKKSGTLITARLATEYGRDVMAIPGDINRDNCAGSNWLIKSGAQLVDSAQDIADYFGITIEAPAPLVDSAQAKLLHLLSGEPKTIDQLILATGEGIEKILADITALEIAGAVFQSTAGCYSSRKTLR